MAAEVGDTEARAALLDYAEKNFGPVWKDGAYYYPRSDDYALDANGSSHGVDTWSGNVLLALARLDKGGGFLKMYREPWGDKQLKAPQVTHIDDVTTSVSQAWYDDKKDALIVTLKPGPVAARRVKFSVQALDPAKSYSVLKDGQLLGQAHGQAGDQAGGPQDGVEWEGDGSAQISTDLEREHTFIIAANE